MADNKVNVDTPTIQEKFRYLLGRVSVPSKSIDVYGSQIVITCHSKSSADKWASILLKFSTVEKVALKCLDDAKVNRNTVMSPSRVTVWRTYARV